MESKNPLTTQDENSPSNVVDVIAALTSATIKEVSRVREQWLIDCLIQAGFDMETLASIINVVDNEDAQKSMETHANLITLF